MLRSEQIPSQPGTESETVRRRPRLNCMGKKGQHLGSAARLLVPIIFALVSPELAVSAAPVDAHSQHAKVELVAAKDAVAPGETAWVGLHFVLEPGWHIYWENPGDSGEPPRIQWKLPAGFRAGQIEWPAPQRLGSGTVIDFGYSGEVLLPIPMAVSATAALGTAENLEAIAKWLVCREICIPDRAALSLTMKIVARPPHGGSTPRSARAAISQSPAEALFAQFRKLVPAAAPSNWKVRAVSEGGDILLSVETGEPEVQAAFYPFLPDPIENSAPQTAMRLNKGVQLKLHKSDQLVKPVAMLKGVLVLGDPQGAASGSSGKGSAYRIAVPVQQARTR
jgi:DsbC/DsbD-like thiol-disulfide interchange protein